MKRLVESSVRTVDKTVDRSVDRRIGKEDRKGRRQTLWTLGGSGIKAIYGV